MCHPLQPVWSRHHVWVQFRTKESGYGARFKAIPACGNQAACRMGSVTVTAAASGKEGWGKNWALQYIQKFNKPGV
ncbi:hypothetical protein Y1Q_0012647 [Alligator mississippiensis]|uniref:Uncharacterized protein n=1 Tax=Alligator mississippiensis TaxID=8496 RepID=A0A151M8E5_ALLMI|nr:hypothetical protein Y1Q_0012647 [Alligator mississippiensis]